MDNKTERPVRKPNRMIGYDYSCFGSYFVTICVKEKAPMLWEDINFNVGQSVTEEYELSEYGKIVSGELNKLNEIYSGVSVDMYCIMPDHIHIIIVLSQNNNQPTPELSRIIQQFKGSVSKKVGFSLWQKSFHDHIIRNEKDYMAICKYIEENPTKYILSQNEMR